MFEEFNDEMEPWHRCVVTGIQYYYESKTACESSPSNHNAGPRSQGFPEAEQPGKLDCIGEWDSHKSLTLREEDLENFQREQASAREQKHAMEAINIGTHKGVFAINISLSCEHSSSFQIASVQDQELLILWKREMEAMVAKPGVTSLTLPSDPLRDVGSVDANDGMLLSDSGAS
ncbi:hypothetical protein F5J12DRAFT_788087 [Pisolithus orientalis]|uniref:uncharacterized protein n=1 Tax=Pisolithus orientalis TaxID=936130 RepID=UPI0022258E11|nr:uncharacterized protein F5J12DRAFT_788087 [Pisolithus orientalis]KAI5982796.1 hypothetical protein F5J12DRAFT_788087 [Pisolithus orientalis]